MTREEAHEKLHFGNRLDYISFNELHVGIDEIYDDFESRTCENCKFEKTIGFDNTCDGCVRQYSRVDKWESKDDK